MTKTSDHVCQNDCKPVLSSRSLHKDMKMPSFVTNYVTSDELGFSL